MALVIVGIAVVVLLVVWVVSAVRVVRPYERGVVERVGRYRSTLSPGLRMMMPLVDTVRMVDMREQVLEVPAQDVITKDNVTAGVDAAVFYAPTDPEKLVYSVANFTMALGALTQAGLRSTLADLPLDDALTGHEAIGKVLRDSLDEATATWGVQVRRVEIQRLDPPAEVIAAMQEQTTAERRRMALVTEADGERQAAIARAEGEHQARIFEAEAEREARALRAEGEAAAMRTMADAERYRRRGGLGRPGHGHQGHRRGPPRRPGDPRGAGRALHRRVAGDVHQPVDQDRPAGRRQEPDVGPGRPGGAVPGAPAARDPGGLRATSPAHARLIPTPTGPVDPPTSGGGGSTGGSAAGRHPSTGGFPAQLPARHPATPSYRAGHRRLAAAPHDQEVKG